MGHSDDENLVLPVKKHNEEGKPLEQNATGSMQKGGVMQGRGCLLYTSDVYKRQGSAVIYSKEFAMMKEAS